MPARSRTGCGIKRSTLVLGVKKGLASRPNERPQRPLHRAVELERLRHGLRLLLRAARKGYANPITLFVNTEAIGRAIARHAAGQGPLPAPDQIDDRHWVYDLGENGDLSVDAMASGGVRDLVGLFRGIPNAKASFATKFVNPDLLAYRPEGKTRIRFSLMPEASPGWSTCGPRRCRSGSPRSTPSWPPATRSTSTSRR